MKLSSGTKVHTQVVVLTILK